MRTNSNIDSELEAQVDLTKARAILMQAKRDYKNELYFDCLQNIEKSLEILQMPELSSILQALHFNTYYHAVDCYVLSASCYYRMEQFDRAIANCNSVLESAATNIKANKIKMLACSHLGLYEEALQAAETILKLKDGYSCHGRTLTQGTYTMVSQQYALLK